MHLGSRRRTKQFRIDRISILTWFMILLLTVITVRLFQIQVINYHEYSSYAEARLEGKVIPARRGRILLKDSRNGFFELANNVTLNLVFADPSLIENDKEVANVLSPLLVDSVRARYKSCGNDEQCMLDALLLELVPELVPGNVKKEEDAGEPDSDSDNESQESIALTEEDIISAFTEKIYSKISTKERDTVFLNLEASTELIKKVQDLALIGIYTSPTAIYANPLEISDPRTTASLLSPLLDMSEKNLAFALGKRANRYVKLLNKVDFETVEAIKALRIRGLGFEQEHWRYYSEQEGVPFLSQTLGFLDRQGTAVYGLEKEWDDFLRGKEGLISGQVDLKGRTITARNSFIREAEDGVDVVLSIDHTVQDTVESLLAKQVQESDAKSGTAIVQNPKTGKIIAMAIYPGFDPNSFGEVYEKKEIILSNEELEMIEEVEGRNGKRYFLPYNPGFKIELFKKDDSFYSYANKLGVGVYRNSIVSEIYEPGSTFKALIMAAAIDAGEIKPNDMFRDEGELDVDCHTLRYDEVVQGVQQFAGDYVCDYTIKNSDRSSYGMVSMTQILEKSLNTGMAFIAKKMGPSLMYDYLQNFGFGEKTYIELPDEEKGKMQHYRNWVSESDMVTKAFGQGIAVTPVQLINAFSALVNGGVLMQPSIIDSTLQAGAVTPFDSEVIRRVITAETSELMKAMLVSSIERGVANPAKIPGYRIGGKTGTSQIATRGKYEQGDGSTYATFAGFGPFEDPQFVVLTKIDRPRRSPWGSTNAAPLFKDIMAYLLQYYQIPPSSKIDE
jgi:stage V sporulation protein D (sporulation-specific penicillin-binding protein)